MTAAIAENPETADQIRLVARDLFCRDGYNGTGMRSLAAAVGIRPGSLYNHIDSKQALLYELVSEYESNFLELFRSKKIGRCDRASQLVTLLWQSAEQYVIANKELGRIARVENGNLTPRQARTIAVLRRRRVRELQKLLSKHVSEISVSGEGVLVLAEELHHLLQCSMNQILDSDTSDDCFVREQMLRMASMLLVKRD
ncbi:Bacterial regulatory protein, tetR family [compost metagenome]